MDYGEILKGLVRYHAKPPPQVDKATLAAKAQAMMKRGYQHDEKTLEVLNAYMQGYGILLSGGVGIGKTYFFETVNPNPITRLSFNVCGLWKFDTVSDFLDDTMGQEIVLDDIGWQGQGRNYGQSFETLQVVLDARLGSPCRTHVTTNCTNDELCERFDGHLVDRLYQMCKCFALPNRESRREAKVNWTYLRNREYARNNGTEEL